MFKRGEKVIYRPNGGVLEVVSVHPETDEYVLSATADSPTGVIAKGGEVEAVADGLSDLDLLKRWVEVLRSSDSVQMGNQDMYVELVKHRKGAPAFEIAFQAVYGVQVPTQATRLLFSAVQGIEYWKKMADLKP